MSRYTGPSCRLSQAGVKLFLKGDRCYSEKCAIARRNTIPGQHSHRRRKFSEYGLDCTKSKTQENVRHD